MLHVMPVHRELAYSAIASSLFSSCFPSSDVDAHLVWLSDQLHAAESVQPYHIDCKLTILPICHCDGTGSGTGSSGSSSGSSDSSSVDPSSFPSSLWSSAVEQSSAAICDLLDEHYRLDKHKL